MCAQHLKKYVRRVLAAGEISIFLRGGRRGRSSCPFYEPFMKTSAHTESPSMTPFLTSDDLDHRENVPLQGFWIPVCVCVLRLIPESSAYRGQHYISSQRLGLSCLCFFFTYHLSINNNNYILPNPTLILTLNTDTKITCYQLETSSQHNLNYLSPINYL